MISSFYNYKSITQPVLPSAHAQSIPPRPYDSTSDGLYIFTPFVFLSVSSVQVRYHAEASGYGSTNERVNRIIVNVIWSKWKFCILLNAVYLTSFDLLHPARKLLYIGICLFVCVVVSSITQSLLDKSFHFDNTDKMLKGVFVSSNVVWIPDHLQQIKKKSNKILCFLKGEEIRNQF